PPRPRAGRGSTASRARRRRRSGTRARPRGLRPRCRRRSRSRSPTRGRHSTRRTSSARRAWSRSSGRGRSLRSCTTRSTSRGRGMRGRPRPGLYAGVVDGLGVFSPETRAWFEREFTAPTPAQAKGWPAIASGKHTLIQAPTGSGKTLAAFLYAIDKLTPTPGAGLRVLYVSPLKALNYDVERNLRGPLAGLQSRLKVAVRTGDTPQKERQAMLRDAPDILITTPESLFLLLTSQARELLRTVETVIVDEVHAVPGTNREEGYDARSIWPSIYPAMLELVRAHRSTIVFVNNRRLAERLALRLNELAAGGGDAGQAGIASDATSQATSREVARAHHG